MVLLAFVMLVVAGAAALTIHNKPTPITTSPTSSANGNNCLLGNSGCSDSKSSSTPTPTTQPAQTTTPSNQQTADNNSSKPASSAPVTCQTEDIPYTTTTQYIANQYNTYSYDEGGINGSEMVCTDGTTDVYSAPLNKVHYVGAIDKAAQDLAAYNQIVAYCRSNNPSGGEITTCVDENLVTYDGYAAYPNNPATEAFLNSLQ